MFSLNNKCQKVIILNIDKKNNAAIIKFEGMDITMPISNRLLQNKIKSGLYIQVDAKLPQA